MNNTQLYLSIGIPTFTVILAWLANRADLTHLGGRIDRLDSRLDTLDNRIDAMSKSHHEDMKMLMGYMVPLHERMAKLEARD